MPSAPQFRGAALFGLCLLVAVLLEVWVHTH